MSYLIAITGKGGVGKTTVASLLITRLIARDCLPVLAVDADPNTCLDRALGVRVEKTVGSVREDAKKISGKGIASGIDKQRLLELKIAESLVESHDFDLIAMGRPEGPGCYCYANNVLKSVLNEVISQYPYVVLDNEAGLENLSRRIIRKVDLLLMVTDPSFLGLETVTRLYSLAREMEIEYDRLAIVVNRIRRNRLPEFVNTVQSITGADFVVSLPDEDAIAELAENGASPVQLEKENPVIVGIDRFLEKIGLKGGSESRVLTPVCENSSC
jgi:CO dehydrogenase maturation factor